MIDPAGGRNLRRPASPPPPTGRKGAFSPEGSRPDGPAGGFPETGIARAVTHPVRIVPRRNRVYRRRSGAAPHGRRAGGVEYDRGMKLKTSITLDKDVAAAVEAIARGGESRSRVIERLLRQSLAARARSAMEERDAGIIDAHADELNEEALDVLGYQAET